MEANSPLKKAVETAGSQAALAAKIGISQQLVSYHVRRGGRIPADWVVAVERATGIPRHELRPDLYEAAA